MTRTPVEPTSIGMLDALHCRFDGPPPRPARAVVAAGGAEAWRQAIMEDRLRRAERACAETRRAVAARRAVLSSPEGDAWLTRLVAALRRARDGATDQRRLCAPSQSGVLPVALQPQK